MDSFGKNDNLDFNLKNFEPLSGLGADTSLLSPYLQVDQNVLRNVNNDLLPVPEAERRGAFEMAFMQIGSSVFAGGAYGMMNGAIDGVRANRLQNLKGKANRTQLINYIAKQGGQSTQTLASIAVIYSFFSVAADYGIRKIVPENNDNYIIGSRIGAGTLTGALYKCSGGLMASLRGSVIGSSLVVAYLTITSSVIEDVRRFLKF
ncbi:hypothetical protein SNEBB_004516 [Seison nebaliae]|nr:hypothetical protein SNEBB_004516 [Seison nebaliae]